MEQVLLSISTSFEARSELDREWTLLLFDENKVKMSRKTEKKRKENPVECTGEGKR